MTQPTNSITETIEPHVLEEFLSDYNYAQSEIENLLLTLEQDPLNTDLLNKLFREVHSIKGNSHFLGFHEMTGFLHVLETLLHKLRNRELTFTSSIGDIVLQAVDQIGMFINDAKNNQQTDYESVNEIQSNLLKLTNSINSN